MSWRCEHNGYAEENHGNEINQYTNDWKTGSVIDGEDDIATLIYRESQLRKADAIYRCCCCCCCCNRIIEEYVVSVVHTSSCVKQEDPLERYLLILLLQPAIMHRPTKISLNREKYSKMTQVGCSADRCTNSVQNGGVQCALSMMGQRSNYARAKDAQILFRMEECA